jgi:hypothetical protein
MGASALVSATLAIAGSAHALTGTVYGGGSSLIGPYLRQAADCYGTKEDLVIQGAAPTYLTVGGFISAPTFISGAFNCTTPVTANTLWYINAGSGNGELGVITHDVNGATDPVFGVTTDGVAPHVQFPSVQYGAGDYGLDFNEVGVYTAGGTLSQKSGAGHTISITPGVGGQATYANPVPLYGNFIQVPMSIDPVAFAFPSAYAVDNSTGTPVTYHLHIAVPNVDGSGGLRLDMKTACGIFNGAITNLNDPAITALNPGLKDPADPNPFNVPIQLAGRSDSSGTTSIFYRALAAQCNATSSGYAGTNNYLPAGGKKLPAALIGAGAGQFQVFAGTTAVATYVAAAIPTPPAGSSTTQFRMTYIGTDYTLPSSTGNGLPYNLSVANIKVGTVYLEPTGKNALASFGAGIHALLPPESHDAAGHFGTPLANSLGHRSNPQDWAQPIATTVSYDNGATFVNTPLADPDHNIPGVTKGYPVVGTTNLFMNTCYNGANGTAAMLGFTKYYYTSTTIKTATTGLLAKSGLAAMPAAWLTATVNTFINPLGEPPASRAALDALNLNILQAGTGPASGTGSQCHAVAPGA